MARTTFGQCFIIAAYWGKELTIRIASRLTWRKRVNAGISRLSRMFVNSSRGNLLKWPAGKEIRAARSRHLRLSSGHLSSSWAASRVLSEVLIRWKMGNAVVSMTLCCEILDGLRERSRLATFAFGQVSVLNFHDTRTVDTTNAILQGSEHLIVASMRHSCGRFSKSSLAGVVQPRDLVFKLIFYHCSCS